MLLFFSLTSWEGFARIDSILNIQLNTLKFELNTCNIHAVRSVRSVRSFFPVHSFMMMGEEKFFLTDFPRDVESNSPILEP